MKDVDVRRFVGYNDDVSALGLNDLSQGINILSAEITAIIGYLDIEIKTIPHLCGCCYGTVITKRKNNVKKRG